MELTRKAFIAALLGLPMVARAANLFRRKPTEVFTISCAEDLPVKLGVGDKLSVSFAAAPSRAEPQVSFIVEHEYDEGRTTKTGWIMPLIVGVPEQHLFIAPRECMITDIRIAAANGEPIRWKRTPS